MDSGEQIRLEDGRVLTCVETVRLLPDKRQVFLGDLEGAPVFAKLYLDPNRGEVHWQRELDGIKAFKHKGVLTAELLYSGVVGDDQSPLILLEYLEDPVSVKQAWDNGDSKDRDRLLREMTQLLAKHHQAGLLQTDLHLDNFVISDGQIYSLDGAGVDATQGEIDLKAGIRNLALFMAQLSPEWVKSSNELYTLYLEQRGLEQGLGEEYFCRQIELSREWRWKKFRSKLFRDCTAIRYRETSNRLEIVSRKYVGPELDLLLFDPDASFPGKEHALKNGTTCTVWATEAGDLPLVVKKYNDKGWLKRLQQKIVPSRALTSWGSSHMLGFFGILTPRPVAVLEVVEDGNTASYFLAEKIDGICLYYWLLDDARSEADLKMMAKKVVGVFSQLHAHRITHGDLKIANWFVVDGEVVLIDLDSMKRHRGGLRFRWLWRSDVRRFMRNWKDLPKLHALFRDEFEVQGLEWK